MVSMVRWGGGSEEETLDAAATDRIYINDNSLSVRRKKWFMVIGWLTWDGPCEGGCGVLRRLVCSN